MIRLGLMGMVVALVAGLWWQLQATRSELAAARSRVAGYEEAARWRKAESKRAAEAAALDETLRQETGADAPLSDYLRGAAGRVWP